MKILVCLDESGAARGGLKVAVKHAKAFGATVDLITSFVGGTRDRVEDEVSAQENLQKAQEVLKSEGISSQVHLLIRGLTPGEDIVKFSEDNAVDEIIIGIKKTSKVGKLVFGSTAQYVILRAQCPVVAVK